MANKQHDTRQKLVFRQGTPPGKGAAKPTMPPAPATRKPGPPPLPAAGPAPGTPAPVPAGQRPRQPRKLIGSSDS